MDPGSGMEKFGSDPQHWIFTAVTVLGG
jgi:hypothetical protein